MKQIELLRPGFSLLVSGHHVSIIRQHTHTDGDMSLGTSGDRKMGRTCHGY